MLWPRAMVAPTILAFDTAAQACSAALCRGETVLARAREERARGHAEALMPMIGALMAEAGLAFAELDALAVTVGPGTFTGIRIGVAAARGLALAAGKPVVPLTTLEVMIGGYHGAARPAGPVLAAIDARKGGVYWQLHRNHDTNEGTGPMAGEEPAVTAPAMLVELLTARGALAAGPPLTVIGSGAARVVSALDKAGHDSEPVPGNAYLDAVAAARLAMTRPPQPGFTIAPLYLRPPDALPSVARA